MFKKVIDNGQSYYAIWWVARASLISCIIEGLVIIALIIFLCSLFPLKEIRPMLLTTQDKANQVVKVEPLEKNTKGWDLLMEKLAQQYVLDRETIDCHTEQYRWQKLALFSSEELNASFAAQMTLKNPESPLKQFADNGITRTVHIVSSVGLGPSAPDLWQVEWGSVDTDSNTHHQTRGHWVSTLTVNIEERSVSAEDQYVNPIGFTVVHYSVSHKQMPEIRDEKP